MNVPVLITVFMYGLTFISGEPVCCADDECYSTDPPWKSSSRPVPDPRCINNFSYVLVTRSNIDNPYNFTSHNTSMVGSPYSGSRPTVLLFHGWMNSTKAEDMYCLVNAYLANVDANVILVNYSNVISNVNYSQAVSDIRVVARNVSKFVNQLIQNNGTAKSRFHLVGLSMGAHAAAYVGKSVSGLGKITGLDPAGPLFEEQSCDIRICRGDANFVEIVHTNADPVWGLGTNKQSGDVDFLVNGGFFQPGCGPAVANWALLKSGNYNIIENAPNSSVCSHARALLYYKEALRNRNCTFWAVKAKFFNTAISWYNGSATRYLINPFTCNIITCTMMGLSTTDYPARGIFLVAANEGEPYCVRAPLTDKAMKISTFFYKTKKKFFR